MGEGAIAVAFVNRYLAGAQYEEEWAAVRLVERLPRRENEMNYPTNLKRLSES